MRVLIPIGEPHNPERGIKHGTTLAEKVSPVSGENNAEKKLSVQPAKSI